MRRSYLRFALVLIPALVCFAAERGPSLKDEMRFGVEAAEHGLWREAIFRWEKFLKDHPDSPRLRNNLAVAYESLGEFDHAEAQYKEALALDPENKEIRNNYKSFDEFRRLLEQRRAGAGAAGSPAEPASSVPQPGPAASPAPTPAGSPAADGTPAAPSPTP